MDRFANDGAEQRDEAFQEAAARLGMSKAIIEKDFWVCWSLKHLFAVPSFGDHMIFKGGTSLSKVYDAIHRFSEDVDLSPKRAKLGFEGDHDPENPIFPAGSARRCYKSSNRLRRRRFPDRSWRRYKLRSMPTWITISR